DRRAIEKGIVGQLPRTRPAPRLTTTDRTELPAMRSDSPRSWREPGDTTAGRRTPASEKKLPAPPVIPTHPETLKPPPTSVDDGRLLAQADLRPIVKEESRVRRQDEGLASLEPVRLPPCRTDGRLAPI